jgi:hypothetical protein
MFRTVDDGGVFEASSGAAVPDLISRLLAAAAFVNEDSLETHFGLCGSRKSGVEETGFQALDFKE